MKSNAQLFSLWLGRIFANAIVGGFYFAAVGVMCGIGAGGLTGMLQGGWYDAYTGAWFGCVMGFASGLPGSLIYAVAAARAEPGDTLQPCKTFFVRVSLGQIFGTVSAISAFVCVEIVRAHWQNVPLSQFIMGDSITFMFGAPALMICGAIAGALWKRDTSRHEI